MPVYMFHRYQLEAVSKLLGGLYYTYAVRGDGQKTTEMIPAQEQRNALLALLQAIEPDALVLPEHVLQLIPPRPLGYWRTREVFNIRTGITFDPLAAAESAASLIVRLILHPQRAARLVEYHARGSNFPGLIEVIDQLINSTWKSPHGSGYPLEVQRVVDKVVLYHLMALAANEDASEQVRAIARLKLDQLKNWLAGQMTQITEESQKAHYFSAISQIHQFQENPKDINITKPVNQPAGPPIGLLDCGWE